MIDNAGTCWLTQCFFCIVFTFYIPRPITTIYCLAVVSLEHPDTLTLLSVLIFFGSRLSLEFFPLRYLRFEFFPLRLITKLIKCGDKVFNYLIDLCPTVHSQ